MFQVDFSFRSHNKYDLTPLQQVAIKMQINVSFVVVSCFSDQKSNSVYYKNKNLGKQFDAAKYFVILVILKKLSTF